MMNSLNNSVVLIPALEPELSLISYIRQLQSKGFTQFVIVDDGSGAEYDEIFEPIKVLTGCHVIRYEPNKGKGYALKAGCKYSKTHFLGCSVITADSDGQHLPDDVKKLAESIANYPHSLILGVRDFSLADVPRKSRTGNRFSSAMFYLTHRKWLPDTQTGLRAFDSSLIELMTETQGERFEYETCILSECVNKNIDIIGIPIETVYSDNNKGTHFRAVRDSFRVIYALCGRFLRFLGCSAISTAIDLGLAYFLFDLLRPQFISKDLIRITVATVIARVVSLCINFFLNRNFVFKNSEKHLLTFSKYIMLCILIMCLSSLLVYSMSTFLYVNEKIAKLAADSLLFFLSYFVQRSWVFKTQGERTDGK